MSNTYGRWRGAGDPRFPKPSMQRGRHPSPWRGRQSWGEQNAKIPRAASPPLGDTAATIRRSELSDTKDTQNKLCKISSCCDVASYNRLNKSEPTILTPGKPPAWTPLSKPVSLRQDGGEYFLDINVARYPAHPLEPAARAVLNKDPDLPTTEIDLVACSNTLGNLLRYVREQDHPFRMSVEVIGSTVFLVRREDSAMQLIDGIYGYGHTFPEAYTTWANVVKGSDSHQRITRYQFGGLDCLVRYEADGYFPELLSSQSKDAEDVKSALKDDEDDSQLLSTLEAVGLGTKYLSTSEKEKALNIRQTGEHIPSSALFDLKTRSIKKKANDILGEQIGRLWVTQIPNFVLAFHQNGVFNDIEIHNVRKDVQKWEEGNQIVLRRFATLLKKLVAFVRASQDGRLELRREEGSDVLELRDQTEDVDRALPDDLETRWILGEW